MTCGVVVHALNLLRFRRHSGHDRTCHWIASFANDPQQKWRPDGRLCPHYPRNLPCHDQEGYSRSRRPNIASQSLRAMFSVALITSVAAPGLEGCGAGIAKQPEPDRKIGLGHLGEFHMHGHRATMVGAGLQQNRGPEARHRCEVRGASAEGRWPTRQSAHAG